MGCHGEKEKDFVKEFYPAVKQNMIYTVGLRTTPSYTIGERLISVPDRSKATEWLEWFEVPEPGWWGMTAHIGGLHLAQLRIAERLARLAGDDEFAGQCAEWIEAAAQAMEERLWTGSYYLNFLEPETGKRSDWVFGYQLDGEWITDQHGLPSGLPEDRVKTVLETIKRHNIQLSRSGAVNYAKPDGSPRDPAKPGVMDYGVYSYFPPEALMLSMNYMYEGQREFGTELARKVWENIVCTQG